MNLDKIIEEQQERNREKADYADNFHSHVVHVDDVDQITTDTAHAVALAVIGELEKYLDRNGVLYNDDYDNFLPTLKNDLTTLEAKIKDHENN